jgi:hypothetical protein
VAVEDVGGYVGDPATGSGVALQPGYRGRRDQREHDRDRMITALVGPLSETASSKSSRP